MSTTYDPYAGSRETTEGRVYTVTGGDWDLTFADPHGEDRLVVNMGPQHPSTHGVGHEERQAPPTATASAGEDRPRRSRRDDDVRGATHRERITLRDHP